MSDSPPTFQVSQSSAATYLRWGENFNKLLFHNSFLNIAVKKLRKSVNICQSYRKNKSGTFFMAHGVQCNCLSIHPCTHSPGGPSRPATTLSIFSFHSILFTDRWSVFINLKFTNWSIYCIYNRKTKVLPPVTELLSVSLTYKTNLIIIKVDEHANFLRQMLSSSKIVIRRHPEQEH